MHDAGHPIDMRAAWNRTSAHYQSLHEIPTTSAHYGPWAPDEQQLRLLGDVSGQRILELGCGGGQCSIAFARAGARVVGLDLSDDQIAYAEALAVRLAADEHPALGERVHFQQGDAADLSPFEDASFDIVFSAYALHYVAAIDRCLAGVNRVLVPGGRLVFSLDHPFRDVFWDQEEGEESLVPARSYWTRGPNEWQFSETGQWMRSYQRTVGDWVDLLHGAGLRVERIVEPEPVLVAEEDVAWADNYGPSELELELVKLIPQTIIYVARKGAAPTRPASAPGR